MEPEEILETEIDIEACALRGEEPPRARFYRVRINDDYIRVETPDPEGESLLARVHQRPCRFDLIEVFHEGENQEIGPENRVNLRKRGLTRFITAHKDVVTIFVQGEPVEIRRGEHTPVQVLTEAKVVGPDGYDLLEEKEGQPLLPIPDNKPIRIEGCEVFHYQAKTGGSS